MNIFQRVYWTLKLWQALWCFKRWVRRVFTLPEREALIEVTRLRWRITQQYPEGEIKDAFLRALDAVERIVRQRL